MIIKIPKDAYHIITVLEQNGFDAYAVGGCIRDSLLGLSPNDWDICTNALPQQIIACFSPDFKIITTGIQHGTITIIIQDEQYEVTTYRTDGEYSDNRHPKEVNFVTKLEDDLSRRDFTINALAYNHKRGLIDCFNGCDDLKMKLIRCVGEPDERFSEDALRIMRALRFASTYDFNIDIYTQSSLRYHKELLNNIASERINAEFCKLLCGKGAGKILTKYCDVFCVFIPELKPMIGFVQNNPYHDLDVWQHTVNSVVNAPYDLIIRLTMLLHDIAKPMCYETNKQGIGHFYQHQQYSADIATNILKRLKFDNNTVAQIKELILYHDIDLQANNKSIKRWLNKLGEQRLLQLIQVKKSDIMAQNIKYRAERLLYLEEIYNCIDSVLKNKECFSLKDLAINGNDLIKLGISEGITIGIVLNKLMDMVIDEQIENDKQKLLFMAKLL